MSIQAIKGYNLANNRLAKSNEFSSSRAESIKTRNNSPSFGFVAGYSYYQYGAGAANKGCMVALISAIPKLMISGLGTAAAALTKFFV